MALWLVTTQFLFPQVALFPRDDGLGNLGICADGRYPPVGTVEVNVHRRRGPCCRVGPIYLGFRYESFGSKLIATVALISRICV